MSAPSIRPSLPYLEPPVTKSVLEIESTERRSCSARDFEISEFKKNGVPHCWMASFHTRDPGWDELGGGAACALNAAALPHRRSNMKVTQHVSRRLGTVILLGALGVRTDGFAGPG